MKKNGEFNEFSEATQALSYRLFANYSKLTQSFFFA